MSHPRKTPSRRLLMAGVALSICVASIGVSARGESAGLAQVPGWSKEDDAYFLHGSLSTEIVPESVARAFIRVYPEIFPTSDFSHLGMIPDPDFGWPIGITRRTVKHLGGLPSLGVNCAGCHVIDIVPPGGVTPIRLIGVTSVFDSEAFFGSLIGAGFRTGAPANMKKFLAAWLSVNDPAGGDKAQEAFAKQWQEQEEKIKSTMADEAKSFTTGVLLEIAPNDLKLDADALSHGVDLAALSKSMLALFHNMRAALHLPDQPPEKAPQASGPGRDDAFGVLSIMLFGLPQPHASAKYGILWNLDQRHWVHWDGNTQSPLGRNLLASLGLGAPLIGHHSDVDLAMVKRHTELSEKIRPPAYPFPIDRGAAHRGEALFAANCASCHTGEENDARLHSPQKIGTDPMRATIFTPEQAARFDEFFADFETPGYQAPPEPPIRSTELYWAPSLGGVWARSPYLHNGSVRTLQELLSPPAARAKKFHRGSRVFDSKAVGFTDEGPYLLDTAAPGDSNGGHEYGTQLSDQEKGDLLEFLKTM